MKTATHKEVMAKQCHQTPQKKRESDEVGLLIKAMKFSDEEDKRVHKRFFRLFESTDK